MKSNSPYKQTYLHKYYARKDHCISTAELRIQRNYYYYICMYVKKKDKFILTKVDGEDSTL